ncbi:alkylation response protein AidB-like acyl-CoA dehydrogenase [Antricoccus suffuscus]|uniref:Alkylation response protein AidB-like acyl-CoA dehydrogenase n=1 Tax=Antricoccus suffuscus TaxID=1629062 RepID=A0A2T0ZVZ0_9ACTN|nr:acyl-CoA dehydrogenase family protein [Antricoccus suffuscus]PRZ40521.1 alkylation response protein AidB-like acyl-CoA dehydrogenase [Antricoccus suffuscus]
MSTKDIALDVRGQNFFMSDRSFQSVLPLRLDAAAYQHLRPHFERLGELAGGRLDELAEAADKNPPVLHQRDRFGRDEDWIEYHPAYREMEQIGFGEFGLHAMTHRPGVLGLDGVAPHTAKYALQYLFCEAEYGIMCPISAGDTTIYLIRNYGSPQLQARLLPRMLSQDVDTYWRGSQFLTETAGGSDVGAAETVATPYDVDEDGVERWTLTGDKWFCSHTDADACIIIARRHDGPSGTKGLSLFVLPKTLEDGTRNSYRIVRLKDKLGTRSMASGEIKLNGAIAYLLGDPHNGIKQAMAQVNLSRLSHAVRAAGRLRRCVTEALAVARSRNAFGKGIIEFPLLRRQLMKLMVPSEQALSMTMFTAQAMDAGEEDLLRILTPLIKLRVCRDLVEAASTTIELRGGNGYIEDWSNARIFRDAQIGPIWEGTTNINAIDTVGRAVAREGAHKVLADRLRELLDESEVPATFNVELHGLVDKAFAALDRCAHDPDQEQNFRIVSTLTYHVVSAVLLATEGAQIARQAGDARRLLLARQVVDHWITPVDPFNPTATPEDAEMVELLLTEEPVNIEAATRLIGG